MKPNHHSDALDQKIDALLASRPLQPSDDFAARVLAQAEADTTATATATKGGKHPLGTLLKFALPLAAAVAITFSLLQLKPSSPEAATQPTAALSAAEAQEIFLLEESLSSLATLGTTEFGSEDLLDTLDALYLEI